MQSQLQDIMGPLAIAMLNAPRLKEGNGGTCAVKCYARKPHWDTWLQTKWMPLSVKFLIQMHLRHTLTCKSGEKITSV